MEPIELDSDEEKALEAIVTKKGLSQSALLQQLQWSKKKVNVLHRLAQKKMIKIEKLGIRKWRLIPTEEGMKYAKNKGWHDTSLLLEQIRKEIEKVFSRKYASIQGEGKLESCGWDWLENQIGFDLQGELRRDLALRIGREKSIRVTELGPEYSVKTEF